MEYGYAKYSNIILIDLNYNMISNKHSPTPLHLLIILHILCFEKQNICTRTWL